MSASRTCRVAFLIIGLRSLLGLDSAIAQVPMIEVIALPAPDLNARTPARGPSADAAAFAVGSHWVHHWNMCGNVCPTTHPGVDHEDAPAVLYYMIATANPRPVAAGVNEACFTALAPYAVNIVSLGYNYSSSTRTITKSNVSAECGNFGNAVFHIGAYVSRSSFALTPAHPLDTANGETRRVICVRFNMFAIPVMCSGHITNRDDAGYAIPQAISYRDQVNVGFAGKCRWITGDFNLTPDYSANPYGAWRPNYYDAGWDEVDEPSPWQPTHNSNTKIDYIWLSASQHSSNFSLAPPWNPGVTSDHYYLEGSLDFSSSCP